MSVEAQSPVFWPGTESSRRRSGSGSLWKEFVEQHWDLMVATDYFVIEAWTQRGLQRFIVLFMIDLSTRRANRRHRAYGERDIDEPGRA